MIIWIINIHFQELNKQEDHLGKFLTKPRGRNSASRHSLPQLVITRFNKFNLNFSTVTSKDYKIFAQPFDDQTK